MNTHCVIEKNILNREENQVSKTDCCFFLYLPYLTIVIKKMHMHGFALVSQLFQYYIIQYNIILYI